MSAEEPVYAFDNARPGQRERLRLLEEMWDAGTIARLEARGVERGWRCLEVGAGGGSIAAWLCDRVGPEGSVVATDLDTSVLSELSLPNLEIRVHDVLADELPEGEFDLVHMRLLVAWLDPPGTGLRRLVASLKPGGWLLAEELDFGSSAPDPRMGEELCALVTRWRDAHNAVLAGRHGFDPFYGRRLAGDVADAGLEAVGSEGRVTMWRGREPGGRLWRLTLEQLREPITEARLMTPDEIDGAMALCEDPRIAVMSPVSMAAWGRRAT